MTWALSGNAFLEGAFAWSNVFGSDWLVSLCGVDNNMKMQSACLGTKTISSKHATIWINFDLGVSFLWELIQKRWSFLVAVACLTWQQEEATKVQCYAIQVDSKDSASAVERWSAFEFASRKLSMVVSLVSFLWVAITSGDNTQLCRTRRCYLVTLTLVWGSRFQCNHLCRRLCWRWKDM